MSILALDLGRQMGWALSTPPHSTAPTLLELEAGGTAPKPQSGSKCHGSTETSPGQRYASLRGWLNDMRLAHRPRQIVFEAALPVHKGAQAARLALGMVGIVEGFACEFGIRCYEVNVGTVKLHATGNGHAKKPEMMDRAQRCGWDPVDDNETDALWLLDYFIHSEKQKGRLR